MTDYERDAMALTFTTSRNLSALLVTVVGLAAETHPDLLREALAKVFNLAEVERLSLKATSVAGEAIRAADELAGRLRDIQRHTDRLEALLMRLAEIQTTRGMKDRALPAESSAGPAAGGAYRAGPTGTSEESQAGAVPAGPGVAAKAARVEISMTDGVAERPTDHRTQTVDTAGPAPFAGRGTGLRIVG